MKYTYKYSAFPDCPEATEFSRVISGLQDVFGRFVGLFDFVTIVAFLPVTYNAIKSQNLLLYLQMVGATAIAFFLFFVGVILFENLKNMKIEMILFKAANKDASKDDIKKYKQILKRKYKVSSHSVFKFISVFAIFVTVSTALMYLLFMVRK